MLCRFVARKKRGKVPMSNHDIAYISGLARCTVSKLSQLTSWRTVPVETAFKFSMACGVNLLNQERTRKFIRHTKLTHMENSRSPQQKKLLKSLLDKLATGSQRASATAPNR